MTKAALKYLTPVTLAALSGPSLAQVDWISYSEDPTRLAAAPEFGSADTAEKDYGWGDLNNDGLTDLVSVRKAPYMSQGREPNVLFMNEGGVLVDRTALYATAADDPGDSGFATPTNDRDVVLTDVNLDGWLDVITATTLSPNEAKAISHPRVYINLGADGTGAWLGLRYETDRIPDLGSAPNFCGVAAGDVTGDGFPDLYFAHYDEDSVADLNDRLLVNDGNGFFVDESASRMTSQMLDSSFGTCAEIADINGDGVNDVIKSSGVGTMGSGPPVVRVSYNNPSNPGFFNIYQEPSDAGPYHVNVGDLNQDGKLDLVISDDGMDRYLLNEGNDGLGRAIWDTYNFTIEGDFDDGIGGNNIVADLDNDGWADVLVADVDPVIPGCSRRLHIYHNRSGILGGPVLLREEAGSGSTGVSGMTTADMTGTHDVAVLDLDDDGDLDPVLGRCTSTHVWINDGPPPACGITYCGADQNPVNSALIKVSTCDSTEASIEVTLYNAPANQFGYLLVGDGNATVSHPPGADGDLCVVGGSCLGRYDKDVGQTGNFGLLTTDILSAASNPCQGAVNITAGATWNFQYWHRRPGGASASFSEAIQVTFQ